MRDTVWAEEGGRRSFPPAMSKLPRLAQAIKWIGGRRAAAVWLSRRAEAGAAGRVEEAVEGRKRSSSAALSKVAKKRRRSSRFLPPSPGGDLVWLLLPPPPRVITGRRQR